MRRMALGVSVVALGFALLVGLAVASLAGETDVAAILDKAVKAHFPKGLDTKNKAVKSKAKGTLHIQGLDLEFVQEVSVQAPKLREAMEMTVQDKKINVVSVYNGKEAWIRADGKDVKVTEEILAEFKDAAYMMNLMQGAFSKDKSVKFTMLGEVKVKGKAAVGVTASKKGSKDINLYFDKSTGLICKVEMRRKDLMSGQEVTEERYITEYQDVQGRKSAKKIEVLRDGKAFLEAEVTEVQILEKLDDSEFAQPK